MSKKHRLESQKNSNDLNQLDIPDYKEKWITDGAWKTGLLGAISVLLCAYCFHQWRTFQDGLYVLGWHVSDTKETSAVAALVFVVIVMLVAEFIRVWRFQKTRFISVTPLITSKRYRAFILDCFARYLSIAALFWLVILFYQTAGEYGFAKHAKYYQVWFFLVEKMWLLYLIVGLPYIMVTRAFKHDTVNDQKDYTRLVWLTALKLSELIRVVPSKKRFDENALKSARGLLVKIFFTPIMTVFFVDQFSNLVNNFDYISSGLIHHFQNNTYTHRIFNKDLVKIGMSVIFSIDVALAWAGYVVSSRWLDNQTISAEPTLMGWLVCLLSYPPFRVIMGWLYVGPGDQMFLHLPDQTIVTVFAIMMTMSYLVYMSSTLCFGLRFSNLTHRGIIRTGAFALVRHPAYTAKNFGWWCVGFPVIVFNLGHVGIKYSLLLFIGLCVNTWIYYLRAITEERHLSQDVTYQNYCKNVRYRFIPGLV